jgi:hypothetical protein
MEQAVGAASVVVGRDGGTVRAEGRDGTVAAGDDAAAVLQSAVDALPDTGGRIAVLAGHYEVGRPVSVVDKHSTYVVGEGAGLDAYGDTSGATTLTATGDHPILRWVGEEVKLRGGGTAHLHLVGDGPAGGAANLFHRGHTDRVTHVGTESESAGYGCLVEGVADASHFVNCGFQHNGTGLRFDPGDERFSAAYPKLFGGEYSDNASVGVAVADAYDAKVVGTTAVRNGEAGFALRGTRHALLSGVNASGCGVGVTCERSEAGHPTEFVSATGCALYNNDVGAAVTGGGPVLVSDSFLHADGGDPDSEAGQETGVAVGAEASVLVDGCHLANDGDDVADPHGNATVGATF